MELFGLLPIYKPKDPTSTEILNRLKKLFGIKRIGHTGTLDPFAEGLLLTLLGKATRLAEYYQKLPKKYRAVGIFGIETDTYDITGKILAQYRGKYPTYEELKSALESFKGEIEQIPPPFSAKKVKGKRAYKLARKGLKPELKPVKVKIYDIELLDYKPPEFSIDVEVSGGTYIRSLIHDIGKKLGTGATTKELLRTKIGKISLEKAVPLEILEKAGSLEGFLLPPDYGLDFPIFKADWETFKRLKMGQFLDVKGNFEEGKPVRVYLNGNLAAIGRVLKGKLKPEKVFL